MSSTIGQTGVHGSGLAKQGGRFVLNGRPYLLRMVLDQGYWQETGLTAPNDDALRHEVALAKPQSPNSHGRSTPEKNLIKQEVRDGPKAQAADR